MSTDADLAPVPPPPGNDLDRLLDADQVATFVLPNAEESVL